MASASRSPMEKLPLELLQLLFSLLADISSLRCTALTCQLFYSAFASAEAVITTQVLHNQLNNLNVLPEAIAAWKSSPQSLTRQQQQQQQPWNRASFVAFIDEHLFCRMRTSSTLIATGSRTWTSAEALPLSRLQGCVEEFAGKFAAEMLNKSSTFAYIDAPPDGALSWGEKGRIQRAFYRFEIFCNMFRDADAEELEIQEKKRMFFGKFSHWENEQLGCVYDYLFRVACPAFNEIIEHNPTWGEIEPVDLVEYGSGFDSPYVEHVLSLGLLALHELSIASSYEVRQKVLPQPGFHWGFLCEALKQSNQSDDGTYISEYTVEENKILNLDQCTFVSDEEGDSDTGPADVWKWAHQEETRSRFVYSDSQIALRARGYCLWDRARLDGWIVFQRPWDPPHYPFNGNEQTSRRAEMQMWMERAWR